LADSIRAAYPDAKVTLIGGGRGDFIVTAGERTLWNKKRDGGYPPHATIIEQLAPS